MSADKNKQETTKENNFEIIRPPVMVIIPDGPFLMGTSDEQIGMLTETENWADEWLYDGLFQIEQPQHKITLQKFEIGKFPVTNLEYFSFIYNSGHRVPKNWIGFHFEEGTANHPVTGVSKQDALAYCTWISDSLKTEYRLPNEAEWEKAARGTDGRIYPWGDNFDPWRCNTLESAKRSTTAVGEFSPSGDSVFGVADMSGNVWEWTSSFLAPYPFLANNQDSKCVVRGGAWYYSHKLARCTTREGVLSDYVSPAVGFRIARSIKQ